MRRARSDCSSKVRASSRAFWAGNVAGEALGLHIGVVGQSGESWIGVGELGKKLLVLSKAGLAPESLQVGVSFKRGLFGGDRVQLVVEHWRLGGKLRSTVGLGNHHLHELLKALHELEI